MQEVIRECQTGSASIPSVPHLQEEFIRQYKYIEDLMQRCYPGAQICLDFTMTDILEYFSGIAMHH